MAAVPWTSVLAYKTHMDRQGPSSDMKVASPQPKAPTEYTAILIECSKYSRLSRKTFIEWTFEAHVSTRFQLVEQDSTACNVVKLYMVN